jgi:tripartite-type tricarboxylate transporter receptor subunit TctC
MIRRLLWPVIAGAVSVLTWLAPAQAQQFPSRPVTLIVPFAAGGTTDVGLRALASATEKHLGQPVVVENRAGVGGVLGPMQMATTGVPDGYTIAQIPITVFRYPFTRKSTFDPVNDLSYILSLSGYTRRGGEKGCTMDDFSGVAR